MNNIIDKATLENLLAERQPKISEKEIAFNKARFSIVYRHLVLSYHALGINLPDEDTLAIRAAQIAEKFDCGNAYLKSRFDKAIEIKGLKELRTPITTGDLTNADRLLGEEGKTSCYKNNGRLPNLTEIESWTDEMREYALNYEQGDLKLLAR